MQSFYWQKRFFFVYCFWNSIINTLIFLSYEIYLYFRLLYRRNHIGNDFCERTQLAMHFSIQPCSFYCFDCPACPVCFFRFGQRQRLEKSIFQCACTSYCRLVFYGMCSLVLRRTYIKCTKRLRSGASDSNCRFSYRMRFCFSVFCNFLFLWFFMRNRKLQNKA